MPSRMTRITRMGNWGSRTDHEGFSVADEILPRIARIFLDYTDEEMDFFAANELPGGLK